MRIFSIMFYLLLILFGVSFSALNANTVTVNFYFAQFTTAISIALLGAFGLGMLMGVLLFIKKHWKLKGEVRKANNQIQIMEKELNNLRVMPLKDRH